MESTDEDGCFDEMLDCPDFDEKWWFLSGKQNYPYIVYSGEEFPPGGFMKHKSYIIKEMCLCTSAQPLQNPKTGKWWDGKIRMVFLLSTLRRSAHQRIVMRVPSRQSQSMPTDIYL